MVMLPEVSWMFLKACSLQRERSYGRYKFQLLAFPRLPAVPIAYPACQLYAHWADFHCNETHIIAKASARRESLHLFDDLMTQFKSGQFTAPIHSF